MGGDRDEKRGDAGDRADAMEWPFDQAPNVAALTVSSILAGQPILYVSYDAADDGWQFLDGRPVDADEARVISMAEALRLDGTLRQIADLPPGWVAWRRESSQPWSRAPRR
jgi:hypothetical protein